MEMEMSSRLPRCLGRGVDRYGRQHATAPPLRLPTHKIRAREKAGTLRWEWQQH
jgi:hypothetical protein